MNSLSRAASRCAKRPAIFHRPPRADAAYYEREGACLARHAGLRIGEYFDLVEGVAAMDGGVWIMGENMWHGWPDPPQFAFFALDAQERVVAATNFDDWPSPWRLETEQAT